MFRVFVAAMKASFPLLVGSRLVRLSKSSGDFAFHFAYAFVSKVAVILSKAVNDLRKLVARWVTLSTLVVLLASSCPAAVLVTTGSDQGKAFIQIPDLTFQITTSFVTTGFAMVFQNVLPPGTSVSYSAGGGGLSIIGTSGSYRLTLWSSGPTGADAALFVDNITPGYAFTTGQTYSIRGGRFTLSNPTPIGFPVFATGTYNIVLQDCMVDARVLSGPAIAVPEPSAFALAATLGAATVICRRRASRRRCAPGDSD